MTAQPLQVSHLPCAKTYTLIPKPTLYREPYAEAEEAGHTRFYIHPW